LKKIYIRLILVRVIVKYKSRFLKFSVSENFSHSKNQLKKIMLTLLRSLFFVCLISCCHQVSATITQLSVVSATNYYDDFNTAILDPSGTRGYYASFDSRYPNLAFPSRVYEFNLSSMTVLRTLEGVTGQDQFYTSVYDPQTNIGYFSAMNVPCPIVAINLTSMTRISTAYGLASDSKFHCVVSDISENQKLAWYGTNSPGASKIVQMNLQSMTRVGSVSGISGETTFWCGIKQPSSPYGFFGTWTAPVAYIVKFNLIEMTRLSRMSTNPGETNLRLALIDAHGRYGYFSTWSLPVSVIKVSLDSMTRAGSLQLSSTSEGAFECAKYDTINNILYFGSTSFPAALYAFDPVSMELIETFRADYGFNRFHTLLLNNDSTLAWTGALTNPGQILKLKLNVSNANERPSSSSSSSSSPSNSVNVAVVAGTLVGGIVIGVILTSLVFVYLRSKTKTTSTVEEKEELKAVDRHRSETPPPPTTTVMMTPAETRLYYLPTAEGDRIESWKIAEHAVAKAFATTFDVVVEMPEAKPFGSCK
jgi:hypothetical protein